MYISRFNGNFISAYLPEYLHYSRIVQALISLDLKNVYIQKKWFSVQDGGAMENVLCLRIARYVEAIDCWK